MKIDKIKSTLKESLSPYRFLHSVNVMDMSVKLAIQYKEDLEKAAVAGLLHDCAREIRDEDVFQLCKQFGINVSYVESLQPVLLHGPIGSVIAKNKYEIIDNSILSAIHYHTTGHENMDILEKIVFIADYIEPNRDLPEIDSIRELAFTDIDRALLSSIKMTITHLLEKGCLIHADTVNARNSIISKLNTDRRFI